jgi:protein O-GlcNAc transferase
MSQGTEPDIERDRAVADVLSALADGRIEDALAGVAALAERLGGVPLVFHLVGLASLRLNEPGKAVEAFLAAHEAEPDLREYSGALSIVMSKVGRLVDSLYYQKLSIAATRDSGIAGLLPDWLGNFAEEFKNIAEAPLMRAAEAAFAGGNYAAAAAGFLQECEVAPDSAAAWRGLALASLLDGKPFKAVAAAETLLSLEPGDAQAQALLGRCLAQAGRFDDAMAAHHRASALQPEDADLAWQAIVTAAQRPEIAVAELARLMTGWGDRFVPARDPGEPPKREGLAGRRLRVGIVSAHWRDGGGLDTLIPIVELLDRRRIELFCYAAGPAGTALAVRARQRSNSWCDLNDLDDATASIVMRNDELDVLIDLDGPTRCTRPGLFAARPAGLALTVYGIAEAAEALGFDGVLGDPGAYGDTAPGIVIRVPGGLAVLPSNLTPMVRPPREPKPTVFGSLAAHWQIGPETIAAWSGILVAAPEALLVLDLQRLGGREAAHAFAARFPADLPRDRLLTVDCGDAFTDYLLAVDILLDPIDNPQPEEAMAALALGTPVVTCRSAMPRASLLASWLDCVGLADLVAADRGVYAASAAALADPDRRQALCDRVAAAAAADMPDGALRQAARLGAAIHAAATGLAP